MKTFPRVGLYLLPAVLAVLLASPPAAAAQPACDERRFSLMPYLWLPTIDVTLNLRTPFGNPEVNAKAHPGDYLSEVEMALMLVFEARKGKWLLFSDVTYMKLSDDTSAVKSVNFGGPVVSSTLNTNTQTDVYSAIWTVAGGYNLVQDPKVSLDLFGGARYLYLKSETSWQLTATVMGPGPGQSFPASGSDTERGDVWDGIVGVKGRVKLGPGSWFVPYYLDAGRGQSKSTWAVQTGIGYVFRWGDLILGYRYLAWEQDDNKQDHPGSQAIRIRPGRRIPLLIPSGGMRRHAGASTQSDRCQDPLT
jgi:hypothetical protein